MRTFFRRSYRRLEPPDEWVERLLCTIPGMLHPGNVYLLDKSIREIKDDSPVLEIGSFCGQSTAVIAHFLHKHNKRNPIWCVDPYIYLGWFDQHPPSDEYLVHAGDLSGISRLEYLKFVRQSFLRNIDFFIPYHQVFLFELSSLDFFQRLITKQPLQAHTNDWIDPVAGFSFCFIDGDHAYEAARNDLLQCIRFTKPGTFILMDDTQKNSRLESAKMGREAEKWPALKAVERNPNLLFRRTSVSP